MIFNELGTHIRVGRYFMLFDKKQYAINFAVYIHVNRKNNCPIKNKQSRLLYILRDPRTISLSAPVTLLYIPRLSFPITRVPFKRFRQS